MAPQVNILTTPWAPYAKFTKTAPLIFNYCTYKNVFQDFRIRINFKLFEKPIIEAGDNLELAKDKANAWSLEVEKKKTGTIPSSGKVDTTR